jgi:hypothetical protein
MLPRSQYIFTLHIPKSAGQIARELQKRLLRCAFVTLSQPDFLPHTFQLCYALPHSLEKCTPRSFSLLPPSWPSSSLRYPFLVEPPPRPNATPAPSNVASPSISLTLPVEHSCWARLVSLSKMRSPQLVSTAAPSPLVLWVVPQAVVLSGKLFNVLSLTSR